MNKIVIYLFLSFNTFFSNAQTQKDSLYIWFDKVIGKENLSIYNGTIHLNYDNTINIKNNRYLNNSDFTKGLVCFNNQIYYNQRIKYDLFEDNLVILPENQSYTTPLNISKRNINYFKIFDKKIIYLDNQTENGVPINGFYEETVLDPNFTLFIKHYKKRRDVITDVHIVQEYDSENEYVLKYKNTFFHLKSKNDIIEQFPSLKKEINDYYTRFKKNQNENKIKFMTDLIILVKNSTQSLSN